MLSTGGDYLENKGIVLKARWFVRLTRARPFHAKIMVMPVFYQAVQTIRRALKTIPLFSFLNIFDLNMQNVTKK